MKRINLISIVFFLLVSVSLQAKEKFTSTFKKEFEVNRDATVKISNTFGDIQCFTWDENKVSIEVLVEVTADDEKSAGRIFDKISIEITGDKYKVVEQTKVGNINSRDAKFNILVNVYLPESLNLDFSNKFGNTYIGIVKGKTYLKQSFGTLHASELQNADNEIIVQHGALELGIVKEAVIDISHSDFNIEKAERLKVDAQFTEMEFEKIGKLFIDANFGSLEIDEVGVIDCKLNGTGTSINYLKESILAECKLGKLSIDHISRGFTEVDINGQHSSISIGLDNGASFSYDISAQFASVYLPSNFKPSKEKVSFNSYKYYGSAGDKGSKALIKIESQFGAIEIN
ncbi:MAG: hypothetical protein KKG99_04875 [Bacteroidetes bacterium]|nr:hypothetical protein [Bacteroidota bacterium]